jgi:hypothetical protein
MQERTAHDALTRLGRAHAPTGSLARKVSNGAVFLHSYLLYFRRYLVEAQLHEL